MALIFNSVCFYALVVQAHEGIRNSSYSNNATSPFESSPKWDSTVLNFKRAGLTVPTWMSPGFVYNSVE